jgi:hypothetical protein
MKKVGSHKAPPGSIAGNAVIPTLSANPPSRYVHLVFNVVKFVYFGVTDRT